METFLGIDYATWWFLVLGALFSGYAILDGFDLGVGAIHLFLNKEKSRRVALNAIGPVWDGNEVWIVIGGGAMFAGFPELYASAFSAFYIPFFLFLAAIIFRAVSIEFRSKEPMAWWRKSWDRAFSISSVLVALLLGVTLGNVLRGLPFDENLHFQGNLLTFFNPFSLLVGVLTVALFSMHGALYLIMKTEDRLYAKLKILVKNTTIFFVVMYALATVYTLIYMPHLHDRFKTEGWLFILPTLSILTIANIPRQVSKKSYLYAFLSSSATIAILLGIVALEIFPVFIPTTLEGGSDITVYNAASSEKSLGIMLTIAAIGIPLVLAYTMFVFWTFRGKVRLDKDSY